MRASNIVVVVVVVSCFCGCGVVGASGDAAGEGEGEGEGKGSVVVGADVDAFFAGVAGLWSGPATRTPLGDFPTMAMDLRPVDGRALFSRADLDDENALRFAFDVEDLDDGPTLVFRNGGFFLGVLRDSRTRLLDVDDGRYHFCSVDRGCDYIDAVWTVGGDELRLDANVLGALHVVWDAGKDEDRALGEFTASVVAADQPLPVLSALSVAVSFPAVDDDADVWVFLSTSTCGTSFTCAVARQKKAAVAAGADHAVVVVDQLHPGDYFLNVLLDRDQDLEETLAPSRGDGVAAPDGAVSVDDDAVDASARVVFTL
jgi:hypothetical protein